MMIVCRSEDLLQELQVTELNMLESEPVSQLDLAQQLDATDSQGDAGHEADISLMSGAIEHDLVALPCCCLFMMSPA